MDLSTLREEMDAINRDILALFIKRMDLSERIAGYKQAHGLPVFDPAREREILSGMAVLAGTRYAYPSKVLFSTLFDLSRALQSQVLSADSALAGRISKALSGTPGFFPSQVTVACQGTEGAYSQSACDKLFPLSNITYFRRFEGVFQAVAQGLCQYGVLPIENSSAGSVGEVYDLMKKYDFSIVRSIRLRVDHALLAKPGAKLSDIREIFSHEQAINQCSEWLKTLPGVKVTVCENTAIASTMAAGSNSAHVAAISRRICADLYGLSVLHNAIQNSDNNYTRFICISRGLEIYPGADRTSLMFTVPHRPGALYSVITRFSMLGLNLLKLESRPIPGKDFEFMFYFDVGAPAASPEVIRLLSELEQELPEFQYLGSYAEIL